MPIHESQLPKSVRDRARGIDPKPKRGKAARRVTVAVPYVCVAPGCGWPFMWTTSEDSTPAHVEAHQVATGHARYAMVLT